jgi:hypothetical protein
LPGLLLMCAAPLVAEVLPGATRFSSIFVLPIEICVWGGGALLIREAVRRWHLGWRNLLFLALALAVAEECLIQQTSLAPMVLQLKGQVYARAYGVNYVYFLWALVYEVVFVVFIPIHLLELMFTERRRDAWVSRGGLVAVGLFFVLGSFLAWFTWTQIARIKVFHVPAFNPPLIAVVIAILAIVALLYAAVGRSGRVIASPSLTPSMPPSPWLVGVAGAGWAVLWFGLVLLGFGAMPSFPPWIAITVGLLLAVSIVLVLPRWTANSRWCDRHQFAVVFGTVFGSILISFVGFIGAAAADLYFKIIADFAATGLLLVLGRKVARRPAAVTNADLIGS